MKWYKLNGHNPVECSIMEGAEFLENQDRTVAKTEINGIQVSTVFLGLDHSYNSAIPILFETMVFGGELDQEQDRYASWDEAVTGHEVMCQRVREMQRPDQPEIIDA